VQTRITELEIDGFGENFVLPSHNEILDTLND